MITSSSQTCSKNLNLRVFGQNLFHLQIKRTKSSKQRQNDRNDGHDAKGIAHGGRDEVLYPTEVITVVDGDHSEDKRNDSQNIMDGLLINWLDVLGQLLVVQIGQSIDDGDEHEDHRVESQNLVHVVQMARSSLVLEPNSHDTESGSDDLQQPVKKDLCATGDQVAPHISWGQSNNSLGHQQLVLGEEWGILLII